MKTQAGLEARSRVFGESQFWRRLPGGWSNMWIVNTEIAIVLGQGGVFDKIISKFLSRFSDAPVHFDLFQKLFMLIEGEIKEYPIQKGGLLYEPDDFLGQFARRQEHGGWGGALGALHAGVSRLTGLMDSSTILSDFHFFASNFTNIIRIHYQGQTANLNLSETAAPWEIKEPMSWEQAVQTARSQSEAEKQFHRRLGELRKELPGASEEVLMTLAGRNLPKEVMELFKRKFTAGREEEERFSASEVKKPYSEMIAAW